MFHKIKHVTVLPDWRLCVRFAEGVTKIYDIRPLMRSCDAFARFSDHPEAFEDVHVDVGGRGIVWDDDIDLSCEELWDEGADVETPFSGLLAFSEATELWGLNESTLRKAVTYGKLVEGVDACKFGKQWVISRDAMVREYGQPKQASRTDLPQETQAANAETGIMEGDEGHTTYKTAKDTFEALGI